MLLHSEDDSYNIRVKKVTVTIVPEDGSKLVVVVVISNVE